jgi:hypothetical protein
MRAPPDDVFNRRRQTMRRLFKLAAYAKAPRATFFLFHPIRALKWGAVFYVGKKLYERARTESDRLSREEAPSPR